MINPFAGRRPQRAAVTGLVCAVAAFAAAIALVVAKPAAAAASFPSGCRQLRVGNDGL
jgi:hypothetical protein